MANQIKNKQEVQLDKRDFGIDYLQFSKVNLKI